MGLPLGLLLVLQQPIVVDGHIDTPQRMLDLKSDIAARLSDGHVDIPRMREGGLTAAFFAIWVDARYGPGTAFKRALALIDAVQALVDTHPEVELARNADDVRGAVGRGHIAVLMGVEGGHAIENSLAKLDSLYGRGARYLTLTWNNSNDWAESSTDPRGEGRGARGLTEFGRRVVRRMNELSMLIDVSHVSDATLRDVLAVTTRPVIASHSSCRAIAHHPRNLTDAQLRAIARNGGVVGINFYPVFLDDHFRQQYAALRRRLEPGIDSIRARHRGRPGAAAFEVDKFVGQHAARLDVPSIERLVDHIDHAVQVMGIDYVGVGSDFDGISVLPAPMKDATSLPVLVAALKARGHSDGAVRKILGENFLRLLSAR
ncbi:MAG TPA: dipeptidase [Gemmatimonadales bacterium]|nr:dipeptidase [Gemmatimonadales bacterium]